MTCAIESSTSTGIFFSDELTSADTTRPATTEAITRTATPSSFLYVGESKAGAVGAFEVSGGSLTQLGTLSLPADATAAGIVVS
jgi:hypothetical protein